MAQFMLCWNKELDREEGNVSRHFINRCEYISNAIKMTQGCITAMPFVFIYYKLKLLSGNFNYSVFRFCLIKPRK